MNSKLSCLYLSKMDGLKAQFNNSDFKIKPTNPLLITLDNNDYETSDIKVLIFGQETNSWEGDFHGNIDTLLQVYKWFFNDGYSRSNYGGQFWNGVNRFLDLLNKKYHNRKIGVVWNNIIKIGCSERNKNMPPKQIYQIEREHFNVIREEINILKPDIIIFLSGPNYDYIIRDNFGDYPSESVNNEFTKRQLSKIDIGFGNNVFRTYHPSYLWRTKKINNYFSAIIDKLIL